MHGPLKGDVMREFCNRFLPVLVMICWSMTYAEHDLSLPGYHFQKSNVSTGAEVLRLTPPLIGAFPVPDSAIRGLAYDGQYLWAANSGDGNSLYGAKIYKLHPDSGVAIDTFDAINDFSCGLAWDGEYLWYSEYIIGYIYKLDTATMSIEKSFPAPTTHPFDLAWDGAYLYAALGNQSYISVIDTNSGLQIDSIAATYSSPNARPFGLTFLPRIAPQLLTCDGNYGSNLVNSWNLAASAWVDQWASDPATYPSGLAYDSVTERLWVSCYELDSIYVYDVSQVGILGDEAGTVELAKIEVWPNPFSSRIGIRYQLTDNGQANALRIYDVSGRLLKDLSELVSIIGNQISVSWDGTDDAGRELPVGVYFLQSPATSRAVKLVKSGK